MSLVAYLGRSEKASIPNASHKNWVRILGVCLGILHMVFVSMTRNLLSFFYV